jgi:hypothetical protein
MLLFRLDGDRVRSVGQFVGDPDAVTACWPEQVATASSMLADELPPRCGDPSGAVVRRSS